jgi:hypothetical protein
VEIPYKKADGSRAFVPDVATLRAMVEQGEITADTPIYDVLRGTWCPASAHPLARKYFDPGSATAEALRTSEAVAVSISSSAPEVPWGKAALGTLAGAILLMEIVHFLVFPDLRFQGSDAVDLAGVTTALGSLLVVSISGFVWSLWGERRRPFLAVLCVAPFAAFLVFTVLVSRSYRAMVTAPVAPAVPPAAGEKTPGAATGNHLSGEASRAHEIQDDRAEVERIFKPFVDDMVRERRSFSDSVAKDNPRQIFGRVRVNDAASLTTARQTLKNVVVRMNVFVKKMGDIYEMLDFRIKNSAISESRKEQLADLFREERERTLPEIQRYFDVVQRNYSEADRMLSFLEGIAYTQSNYGGVSASSADQYTIQLYEQRLGETSAQVEEVGKTVEARLDDSARVLREKLNKIE